MDDQKLLEFFNEINRFAVMNGIRLVEFDDEHSVVECTVEKKYTNPTETLHGGMYFTMADSAGGALAIRSGQGFVTQRSTLHFIRPVFSGKVRAVAHALHRGKTTLVAEIKMYDEQDKLLASSTMTYFFLGQKVELK